MFPKRIDRIEARLPSLDSTAIARRLARFSIRLFLILTLVDGVAGLLAGNLFGQPGDANSSDTFGISTPSESALMGIFYDLKQTQQKEKVPMNSPIYDKILVNFIMGGWDESILNKFYRISKPFYTTQVYVPMTPQNQAARAFGVDDKVTGSYWIVHFKGQVIPPSPGRYRFFGYAHATIFVAINGKLVLNGCRFDIKQTVHDFPLRSVQVPSDARRGAPAGDWMLTGGPWVDLSGSDPVDIDNLVAPILCAFLLVEKEGETYPTDPVTHYHVLPLFQVASFNGQLTQDKNRHSRRSSSADAGQALLRIHDKQAHALATWVGKPMIMGIRSEDLEIKAATDSGGGGNILSATVEIAEPMGAETHLYLKSGDDRLIARVRGQIEAAPLAKLEFAIHLENSRYFDAVDAAPFHKANGELDLERWHTACKLIV